MPYRLRHLFNATHLQGWFAKFLKSQSKENRVISSNLETGVFDACVNGAVMLEIYTKFPLNALC
jgi:hypothetical protein